MSNPLAEAAIKTGLIPAETLEEFRRWRAPIDIPEEVPEPPKTLEEAAEGIRQVLESQGYVLTRETDLNVLQQYLSSQTDGTLHVEVPKEAGDEFTTTQADFEVVYGKSMTGEYIFPWQGDNICSEMTNGLTYLSDGNGMKVFFKEVREIFYGEVKAFMLCTVSVIDYAKELTEGNNG